MDIAELKHRAGIITENDSGRQKDMIRKALLVYANTLDGKATTFRVARASSSENEAKAQRFAETAREYEALAQSIDSWFAG